MEHLTNFHHSRDFFLHNRLEHTFHSLLHLFDSIVDDRVKTDVDTLLLSKATRTSRRTHLEAHNHSLRSCSEGDVIFRNLSHTLVNHVDGNRLCGEFDERIAQSLHRTVYVTLHHDVEFLVVTEFQATANLIEGEHLRRAEVLFALQLQTFVGNFACLLFRFHHVKLVASLRSTVETEHRGSVSRKHLFHAHTAFVEQGLHTTVVRTSHEDVALTERTVAHEDSRHVATTLVERTFDDRTHSAAVGVRFEFEKVSFEEHLFEEFVDADARLRRDILRLVLTAPFLHEEVHRSQRSLDGIGVSTGFVDFVDGKDDGHTSSHSVVDGFLRLWHHVVVGSNDDDGDVGDLRTTSTHSREGFVTWSVEESNLTTILELHVVSPDVLGDTTGFTGNHVGVADVVEERSLTVVNVTHHSDDGRAFAEVFFVVHLFDDGLLHFGRNEFCGETKFFGHHFNGFLVKTLVDGHHNADAHASADDLCHRNVHHCGQFVGGHKFGELQHATFSVAAHHIFFLTFASGIAFLTTILRTLTLVCPLGLETSEGFFHLLSHIFIAGRSGRCSVVFLALLGILAATALLLVAVLLVLTGMTIVLSSLTIVSALAVVVFLGFRIHVHAFVADAVALLAFAFLFAFLLRLLLGTSAAVDGREVHRAEHFRPCEARFGVEFEHPVAVGRAQSCRLFVEHIFSRSRSLRCFVGYCIRRSFSLHFRLRFCLFFDFWFSLFVGFLLRLRFCFRLFLRLFFRLFGRFFESIEVDVSHHLQSTFCVIVFSCCRLFLLHLLLRFSFEVSVLFSSIRLFLAHCSGSVRFFGSTFFIASVVIAFFRFFLAIDVFSKGFFQEFVLFVRDFGVEGDFAFNTFIFERVRHALDGDVEFFDYFV